MTEQSKALGAGWQEYNWPDKVPPLKHQFYTTDAGCLYYDNGVWLQPSEYSGWNPTEDNVTRFYVIPDDENWNDDSSPAPTPGDYLELQSQHDQLQTELFNMRSRSVALEVQLSLIHQLFTELRQHHVANFHTEKPFIGNVGVHKNWSAITDILCKTGQKCLNEIKAQAAIDGAFKGVALVNIGLKFGLTNGIEYEIEDYGTRVLSGGDTDESVSDAALLLAKEKSTAANEHDDNQELS